MATDESIARHLRRATEDLRSARRRVWELEAEPIAITSMACRFAGGVDSPARLWGLLDAGAEVRSEFPSDRGWDLADLVGTPGSSGGRSITRHAGFLDEATQFDASFFGISPREALAMDPQQRLLLETTWELVERAGLRADELRGSDTGVYVGATTMGYGLGTANPDVDGLLLTGTQLAVASGRIAYSLGLEGPAVTLDTACSSSLVAMHIAASALRRRECSLAVVGGAAVMADPFVFVEFSRQQGLSPDGRCRAFAAAADGVGFAEGAALVLLERLSDANRAGREVLAVLRGTAVNQDGASNGLSAPNGNAQRRVIRAALGNAGLMAGDIDMVEAHGTGTRLGDPIEASALLDVYGRRGARAPLWLGSVKSNIGHTQAAAGTAAVIKTVLALQHGRIPKTLHIDQPTSFVDWSAGDVRLATETVPWPSGDGTRRAGVSGFGVSGTNAHVIIEEAPQPQTLPQDGRPPAPLAVPWILSGRDQAALSAQARRLADWVADQPDASATAIAATLARDRTRFEHRAVVVGSSIAELLAQTRTVADGEVPDSGTVGAASSDRRVALVFPGQGGQWTGMAAALLDESPEFAAAVQECAAALAPHVSWSLTEVLRGGDLDPVDVVQPALWAVMVSLARLWRHHGLVAEAVVGHSQGEIAAACVAGVLSLDDGARIVAERSRALAAISGDGGMVSLAESAWDATARFGPLGGSLTVAASNSARSVVVAGERTALIQLVAACEIDGVPARMLPVSYAAHSAQVDAVAADLRAALAGIEPGPSTIAFHSTVDNRVLESTALDAEYWARNLREPVRFDEAIRSLTGRGITTFVECSPHPVLVPALSGDGRIAVGSLRRDDGGLRRFLQSVGELHVYGVELGWAPVLDGHPTRPSELPTYPFRRSRHWLEPVPAAAPVTASTGARSWRIDWAEPEPVGDDTGSGGADRRWVVVVPRNPGADVEQVAAAVLDEFAAAGRTVARVESPTGRSALRAVLRSVVTGTDGPVGVLSLLAFATASPDEGLVGTLQLVQALTDLDPSHTALWTVTRSAVATGHEGDDVAVDPGAAAVWGLGRSAALEVPHLWGGMVDLPSGGAFDAGLPGRLVHALTEYCGDDQLVLRDSGSYVARLVEADPDSADPEPATRDRWRPQGAVVLIGGTAEQIGYTAVWLADCGARQVVLAGAASVPEGLADRLAERGAVLKVEDLDLTDVDALGAVLDRPAGDPPTAVLLLSAPVAAEQLTVATEASLTAAVAAKTAYILALGQAFAAGHGDSVETVVAFSSVAGTWGATGRGGYAAGDARVDALARRLHGRLRRSTSVAWAPWAGGRQVHGLRPLAVSDALGHLGAAVAAERRYVTVADVDWAAFLAGLDAVRSTRFFDKIRRPLVDRGAGTDSPEGREQGTSPAEGSGPLENWRLRLPSDRVADLQQLVAAELSSVLKYTDDFDVDEHRSFRELGLDSLMAVELRNRLERRTGLALPPTLIFDRPSISQLAQHLDGELFGAVRPADAGTAGPVASSDDDDPVVVSGAVCRLPGGVDTPEAFWEMLAGGRHTVSEMPNDRGWDLAGLLGGSGGSTRVSSTRYGGFLGTAADFDAGFFGISPREAKAMDPQQRLLLETAWELFERAGIDPRTMRGSATGTFIGSNGQFYMPVAVGADEDLWGHLGIGNTGSVMSGRVAYVLGLEGPALTVDTACSASMVALHLAVQAVRRGECSMAIVGGVTVMSTPDTFIDFTRQQALSPDGRSRAYAAGANGVGLSEGVVQLLVERSSSARAAGRTALGVVRGTAVNQDGASNGLSAPSGPAQQRVIMAALADAGLRTTDVGVVEGHGTGTPLGDPIEAAAIIATYGRDRPDDRPVLLGSAKSNIGHTQAAAGLTGVLKMLLALKHEVVPPTLHCAEPSPLIDWAAGCVRTVAETEPWPRGDCPRRAGVSAFGISGTNAHVIIEEPPRPDPTEPHQARLDGSLRLPWVVSARDREALAAQAALLAKHVRTDPCPDPADVGYSLATTRTSFGHRAVVLARPDEGPEALDALIQGLPDPRVVTGYAPVHRRAVFVFPGQGAQWAGMAAELLDESPEFAARMQECAEALAPHVERSPAEVIRGRVDLTQDHVVQPVLWAVMVSLAALWRSVGVVPEVVVGHSQGEIAAACVSGGLSLADGARVVALRSRLLARLAGSGGMMTVAAPPDAVRARIAQAGNAVAVAAVNGPHAVVLSGDRDTLAELGASWERENVRTRILPVAYASHSAHVDQLADELVDVLAGIAPTTGTVPFFSTVCGEFIDTAKLGPQYWVRNLRETVEFAAAVDALTERGLSAFVECSPHPVLTPSIESDVLAVGTLRRDDGGLRRFLLSAAEAHVEGLDVDWARCLHPLGASVVPLPTYPFRRSTYWPARAVPSGTPVSAGLSANPHPLLSILTELPGTGELVLSGVLDTARVPWLADHAVDGTTILPGTAFVEIAVHAGDHVGCSRLEELALEAPLIVPARGAARLQVHLGRQGADGRREVTIHSRPEIESTGWTRHAGGVLTTPTPRPSFPPFLGDAVAWPPDGAQPIPVEGHYERAAEVGFVYGPAFRGLQSAWRCDGEVVAEVALPEEVSTAGFVLHPALLDAAVQALACDTGPDGGARRLLPFLWRGVELHATGAAAARAFLVRSGPDTVSIRLSDHEGAPLADVAELRLRPALAEVGSTIAPLGGLHRLTWVVPGPGLSGPAPSVPPASQLSEFRPFGLGSLDLSRFGLLDTGPVFVDCADVGPDKGHLDPRAVLDPLVGLLQAWLVEEARVHTPLVLLTRRGASVSWADEPPDLAQASVWGLVRCAQSEHPDRVVIVDLDGTDASLAAIPAAIGTGEPQLAIRAGAVTVPRVVEGPNDATLVLPDAAIQPWRLGPGDAGTLEAVGPQSVQAVELDLTAGEVRVAVRAAGVNFRDVLLALGMYPGAGLMGTETAGVVIGVGSGVHDLSIGDRVMGLVAGGFGPEVVTDRRLLVRIPTDWSFARAATVPVAFLTAWYALRDLAEVRTGESVLVHAAAGGVGTAAVQIAQHLGAEVFATAAPNKWDALRARGIDDRHLASSRDSGFSEAFAGVAESGLDVVLNSLTGELVDASAGLLAPGGRFVEMGKTDLRAEPPGPSGSRYIPVDLMDAGPDRIAEMLSELIALFETGVLRPPPMRAWDIRHARQALTHISQARHVGKVVLTIAPDLDPDGTVLISGAGALGGLLARHLVTRHGVRRIMLANRRGHLPALAGELTSLGAEVTVTACDVADDDELAAMIARVPTAHPLTAVVHTAGVLNDGVVTSLTGAALDAVLRPKVAAALNLHKHTRSMDLAAFVLYSSSASVLGGAGQGAYAAANAALDALARARRAQGLTATSLGWGLWADVGAMLSDLSDRDRQRIAGAGLTAMSAEDALTLFDTALSCGEDVLYPMMIDRATLQERADDGTLSPVLRGLVGGPGPRRGVASPDDAAARDEAGLTEQLATTENPHELLLDLVRRHAATVLGLSDRHAISSGTAFRELGFDSLTAIEMRNRLNRATGLKLPAALVFDHPTPAAVAQHLLGTLRPDPGSRLLAELSMLEEHLSSLDPATAAEIVAEHAEQDGIGERFAALAARWRALRSATSGPSEGRSPISVGDVVDEIPEWSSDEDVFAFLDQRRH